MEKGQVIAYSKAVGKGFILHSNNNLYYLFENDDCLDVIHVGDNVVFDEFDCKEAINVKLQKTRHRASGLAS